MNTTHAPRLEPHHHITTQRGSIGREVIATVDNLTDARDTVATLVDQATASLAQVIRHTNVPGGCEADMITANGGILMLRATACRCIEGEQEVAA